MGAAALEAFNRLDVSRALSLLPGVTLSGVGNRNESMVQVRGFDLRQVPVFLDGIPVYVPFDGYADLGRFTTFDLAQISVEKGFASVMYGPNTLGGAINLVSRRPQQRLEFDGRAGLLSGQGRRLSLNAGSRLGRFYVQGSASQLRQEGFPLPASYTPRAQEDGGLRENAFRNDRKYSLKAGYLPNATDEYALSYVNQQGSKGNPPYAGTDPQQPTRFWKWPYWNKESLYFLSTTRLGKIGPLKARLFYDRFRNLLRAFDNNTYAAQTRASSFNSYYNDDTRGGSLEAALWQTGRQALRASVHYRNDRHREHNEGEPERLFEDQTLSAGLEGSYRLTEGLLLRPGLSYNARQSLRADNFNSRSKEITAFPTNRNEAFNVQGGLFYEPSENRHLSLTLARKTRFPTIKDRYSYRLGLVLPNPALQPEQALHTELNYADVLPVIGGTTLKMSVFHSLLQGVIQSVSNVEPGLSQFQNTGRAVFYGGEASVKVPLGATAVAGGHYSYIEQKNLSNPNLKFTNVPRHKLFAYTQARLWRRLDLTGSMDYNSARYSTSYGTKAAGFTLFNLKGSVPLYRFISVEGGVNNLFDRNYAIIEGFPEAGRNFFVNLVVSNL